MTSLPEFVPSRDLPADFMLIMYGMRRTGKTTALMHMLEEMKDRFRTHMVHVFSGTGNENPAQWRNFPPSCVSSDIAHIDSAIGSILNEQQELIRQEVIYQMQKKSYRHTSPERKKQKTKIDTGKSTLKEVSDEPEIQNDTGKFRNVNNIHKGDGYEESMTDNEIRELRRQGKIDEKRLPRRLIILDDVVNENSIRFSPNLNKLAVSGRHIFITCIILSQCVCGSGSVPPIIRRNSDYIMVVGNPRSTNERKLLAQEYLTISDEANATGTALRVLADVTQTKYRLFVIDVTNSTAKEFADFLFKYGPVPKPPDNVSRGFKLGTKEQWGEKEHHGDREPRYDRERDAPKPSAKGRFEKSSTMTKKTKEPYRVKEFFDPLF